MRDAEFRWARDVFAGRDRARVRLVDREGHVSGAAEAGQLAGFLLSKADPAPQAAAGPDAARASPDQ